MNSKLLLSIFLLTISCSLSFAKKSDRNQPIRILSENATTKIDAENYELEGDILIEQGTLRITGSKINFKKETDQNQIIQAYGKPVNFQQVMDATNKKGKNKFLKGHANNISYNSKTGDVVMTGGAYMNIDGDTISGNRINYNTISEKYKAASSKGGKRVEIILYPQK